MIAIVLVNGALVWVLFNLPTPAVLGVEWY